MACPAPPRPWGGRAVRCALRHRLVVASDRGRHHRLPGRHGLEDRQRVALHEGGEHEDVDGGQGLGQAGPVPDQVQHDPRGPGPRAARGFRPSRGPRRRRARARRMGRARRCSASRKNRCPLRSSRRPTTPATTAPSGIPMRRARTRMASPARRRAIDAVVHDVAAVVARGKPRAVEGRDLLGHEDPVVGEAAEQAVGEEVGPPRQRSRLCSVTTPTGTRARRAARRPQRLEVQRWVWTTSTLSRRMRRTRRRRAPRSARASCRGRRPGSLRLRAPRPGVP